MKKPQETIDKEYQQMQEDSAQLRKWNIQRGMTPKERYALGPTDTWHLPVDYYRTILPRWCPLSSVWGKEAALPPYTIIMTLVRGGLVDTNFISIRNVQTGAKPQVYIQDSQRTRQTLTSLQSYTTRGLAWRFVKTRLIQETHREGWLAIVKQAGTLNRKLARPEWRELLTGRILNLRDHIKIGNLIDSGLMPLDLMPFAMRLITVWIQDYLYLRHPEKGIIGTSKKGLPLGAMVVYGGKVLVSHQKVQLVEFYRNSLSSSIGSFRRPKTL